MLAFKKKIDRHKYYCQAKKKNESATFIYRTGVYFKVDKYPKALWFAVDKFGNIPWTVIASESGIKGLNHSPRKGANCGMHERTPGQNGGWALFLLQMATHPGRPSICTRFSCWCVHCERRVENVEWNAAMHFLNQISGHDKAAPQYPALLFVFALCWLSK